MIFTSVSLHLNQHFVSAAGGALYSCHKNGGSNCEPQIIPENRKEFGDSGKRKNAFEVATEGGTFASATGGIFETAMPGTFETVLGGTIIPLPSNNEIILPYFSQQVIIIPLLI